MSKEIPRQSEKGIRSFQLKEIQSWTIKKMREHVGDIYDIVIVKLI